MTTTTMIYHDDDEAMTASMTMMTMTITTMMISSCSLVRSNFASTTMATSSEAITLTAHMAPTKRRTAPLLDPRTAFEIRPAIAANGRLVPTAPLTARVVDPFSLEGLDDMDTKVDVVDFGAKAKQKWLVGPTGVIKGPFQWWRSNTWRIPLLNEIKHKVKMGKGLLSYKARAPRHLVFVNVRGVTFLVANKSRTVVLALADHHGSFQEKAGALGWFLSELDKDIEKLRLQDKPGQSWPPRLCA